MGRYEEAYRDYTEALRPVPEDWLSQVKRAEVSVALKHFIEARHDLDSVLRRRPANLYAMAALVKLLEEEGKLSEAITTLSNIVAVKRRNEDPSLAHDLGKRAGLHSAQGELDLALADYDQVLEFLPRSFIWWVKRGDILSRMGRFDEALSDLATAAQLRPGNPIVMYMRGDILCRRGGGGACPSRVGRGSRARSANR